jgi:hypothetical protein
MLHVQGGQGCVCGTRTVRRVSRRRGWLAAPTPRDDTEVASGMCAALRCAAHPAALLVQLLRPEPRLEQPLDMVPAAVRAKVNEGGPLSTSIVERSQGARSSYGGCAERTYPPPAHATRRAASPTRSQPAHAHAPRRPAAAVTPHATLPASKPMPWMQCIREPSGCRSPERLLSRLLGGGLRLAVQLHSAAIAPLWRHPMLLRPLELLPATTRGG